MFKVIIFIFILVLIYMISIKALCKKLFKSFAMRSEYDESSLKKTFENLRKSGMADKIDVIKGGMDWIKNHSYENVYIRSRDGLKLRARLYFNENGNGKTAVLPHGFKSIPELDFSIGGKTFYEMGYSLLLIDERAHGESEGKYITFGVKERYDIVDWCKWLVEKMGDDHKFIICGISMGCTSGILASCLPDMPDNLEFVSADCGYTSIIGEFDHVFSSLHIPKFIITPMVEKLCKEEAGFSLYEFDTTEELKKNAKVPYFFIHGKKDDFVPFVNSEKNYAACPTEKSFFISEEAGHGLSFIYDQDRCVEEMRKFFGKHSGPIF